MRPEIQAKLQKIKKVSIVLRAVCKALLALVAFIGISCIVCVTFGVGGINYDNVIFRTAELDTRSPHYLGRSDRSDVGPCCLSASITCISSSETIRVERFSHKESVGQIRQFGIACLLWGVMNFLWGLSLALSSHPSKTFQGHADSFVIGIIIIVIAWFMDMAVDLREENELTI